MIARNVVSSAAIAAGHSLAVARAVGRNAAALRAANRLAHVAPIGDTEIGPADLRTLARAELLDLSEVPVGRSRRRIILAYRLTAAGRALAARL